MTSKQQAISKICTKCGEEKELEEFYKDSSGKYGRQAACKACAKEYSRKHREANKEKIAEANRRWRVANKEALMKKKREYYYANKEKILEGRREYYENNKGAVKRRTAAYTVARYRTDPLFNLEMRCRTRIRHALKGHGFSKTATTKDMLGCTYEELMHHLESQFAEGMTWDNRGDWHIDHIVPLASAETEEELVALCHYTNLQPLWAEDNMSKGATHE